MSIKNTHFGLIGSPLILAAWGVNHAQSPACIQPECDENTELIIKGLFTENKEQPVFVVSEQQPKQHIGRSRVVTELALSAAMLAGVSGISLPKIHLKKRFATNSGEYKKRKK